MKKILLGAALALLFIGCGSKSEEIHTAEAKIVVGKSLANLSLNDQFEKSHTLDTATTKLILALDKETAHICNDFFVTQTPEYLKENNTEFIADVSAAPSLIRSMFIMPGLKDFKHTVLILDDEAEAAPFRSGLETQKIIIAHLENGTIKSIETLTTAEELKAAIEKK